MLRTVSNVSSGTRPARPTMRSARSIARIWSTRTAPLTFGWAGNNTLKGQGLTFEVIGQTNARLETL
jgi:hypothetical protein